MWCVFALIVISSSGSKMTMSASLPTAIVPLRGKRPKMRAGFVDVISDERRAEERAVDDGGGELDRGHVAEGEEIPARAGAPLDEVAQQREDALRLLADFAREAVKRMEGAKASPLSRPGWRSRVSVTPREVESR